MKLIVARTVTVAGEAGGESRPLSDFRSERAYVLLGDPGTGKTTAFETECESDPDRSVFVTARRFNRGRSDHPLQWRGKTLFIDGLDEVRAGSRDARKPIDDVLVGLERLRHPNVRISCRSADWLGGNDLKEIVATAGYEEGKVLRLDPLGEAEIRSIVDDLGIADPDAFIAEARNRSLHGLLQNPQLLEMLVKAVGATGDAEWPDGRFATFEKACELSVREYNEEHRAASRNATPVSVERILVAAGHLSALLLLSDKESVCPDGTDDDTAFSLSDVRGTDEPNYALALRRALQSPLFADHTLGRFPVHRQIAEFLGGRYLAGRVGRELPASRVLALMEGFDGVVVPDLRGLAAWLAASSPESRSRLIETDPVGVTLYGDVSSFTADERNHLLRALETRPAEIDPWDLPELALRSILDRTTIETLRGYLDAGDRSEGRRAVVGLLFRALAHAPELWAADMDLQITIRDASWGEDVRLTALKALLARGRRDPAWTPALMELLDELRDGRVEDRERELLGVMLRDLYPTRIAPDQIWDYLLPEEPSLIGMYHAFWQIEFVKKTGDRAPQAVDALVRRDAAWLPGDPGDPDDPDDFKRGVVLKLVCCALRTAGDDTDPSTILSWLRVLDHSIFWGHRHWQELRQLDEWLTARPDLQKELVLTGLDYFRGHENYPRKVFAMRQTVFGNTPEDYAEWCLRQAVERASSHQEAALQLLAWSRPWADEASGSGLSLKQVRSATADLPPLREAVERFANPPKVREPSARVRTERPMPTKNAIAREEFVSEARAQIEEIRGGTCTPRVLHRIGDAYLQVFHGTSGADPIRRVMQLLGDDRALTEAALAGLENVLDRDDLPSLRDIIRLDENNQMSYLALPLLAGLDQAGPNALDGASKADVARAVALYYLIPCRLYDAGPPPWYGAALRLHRESLTEALVRLTRSRIRNKKANRCLWKLSRDRAHRHVARIVVPKLWRSFPTRCTEPQVEELKELLRAAVRWRVDGIEAIIAERLGTDLDVAQRAAWLSAGLLLSPDECVSDVVCFVEGGEEARCQHIVDFLAWFQRHGWPSPYWEAPVLAAMIALVGSRYSPWMDAPSDAPSSEHYLRGRDMRWRARLLIDHWLGALATRTDATAGEALATLSDNSALDAWSHTVRDSLRAHIVIRRSATFASPGVDAVQDTLAAGPPANAADLAALVVAAFEEIGDELRHGNTDGWRQFWDERNGRDDPRPMHEDRCRDRLLSDLRAKLPKGVDPQPEAHYADDKRADIRLSCNGLAIPVEIKKSHNRQLWSAISDQLVARYTRDPDSDGYGLYLVLWFGRDGTPVPPSGPRPKTPDELRDLLKRGLPDRERIKVSTVVLDVSRREKTKQERTSG